MEDVNLQVKSIKQQVKTLLGSYKRMKAEINALTEENSRLSEVLRERDKKIEEIENKNINLQISRALGKGVAGQTDLRQRLDEYIKEIDAVVAHLKD